MKNYRPYIFTIAFTLLLTGMAPASYAAENLGKTEITQGGKRKKSGRYKKKNGFFKRLFKGKNACDCPKYK